ncbi:hypothetical protein [Lacrimispora amygdalina]|uniref:hypothetical protein n=1 Tax=Lacrimispora amygdalina TaxID=253257 RepID=UPI000BE3D6B8|nr:hypothetical protein [Lacrimispora amygdalina]
MITLEMGASASSYTDYIRLLMNIITGLVVAGSILRCLIVGINHMSNEQPINDLIKKIKNILYAAILCGSIPQIISLIAEAYRN